MNIWIPVSIDSDPNDRFLHSIGQFIKNKKRPICPLCNKSKLKYYYHSFLEKEKLDRGSLWMWCDKCCHWQVASGVPKSSMGIENLLTTKEFDLIDNYKIIESLNNYWDDGKIQSI